MHFNSPRRSIFIIFAVKLRQTSSLFSGQAYYEDTDLSMHINHDLGKRIWYQPLAVARHYEHASFGMKDAVKLTREGKEVFSRRWKSELNEHYSNDLVTSKILARDSRRDSHNILYIGQLIPRRNITDEGQSR